jgi:hypothetical protein
MRQEEPAASDEPQAFVPVVMAKSLGLAPAIEMATPVSAALPVFERANDVGLLVVLTVWLVKVYVAGVSAATGAGTAVPVPESVAVCGEPEALSATDSVALKVVAEAGVNVT